MTGSPTQDKQQGGRRFRAVNTLYKEFAPFLTLGVQLAVAVIVFYVIGSWVDGQYGTSPAFTLVGIMLGTVGGLIKFFKTVNDLNKKEESQKSSQPSKEDRQP
ncbi:MAG TPA: AtpZ/AtpI family protein [Bacteroidota bacterium]